MNSIIRSLLAAGIALAATCAAAHVVLEYQVAPAGSSYKATFKVGHGCGSSATRQVSVAMPPGVLSARPMPKPGWTVQIDKGKLAEPVVSNGRTVTEDVTRVTWTARTPADALPSDQYDEFVVVAQLPAQAGRIWWPVSQVCDGGREDWVEVPAAGQDASRLKKPAAMLEVLPAAGGGHQH